MNQPSKTPSSFSHFLSGPLPLFLAALGCLALAGSGGWGGGEEGEDPLPLRRLVLPPSRLPQELEKVRMGTLVPLPREDFETRVRKASKAQEWVKNPPRLLQARYVAELKGLSLVGRSGTWKVEHLGGPPGILSLPSLNLALGTIRNEGGAEALLGDLDGKNLGLWVEKSGEVFFDWSARGTPRPEGLSFDLRLPSATTATLELALPAEFVVITGPGAVPVSGPREAEEKSKKTWVFHIGGRSQVEFILRRGPEGERTPGLIISQVQSRVQVWPDGFGADFDFQLDLLHTSARELTFVGDPGLEVFDVSSRTADVLGWEVRDIKPSGSKKEGLGPHQQVVVRFRDSVRGSLPGLKVRCLGNWPAGKVWELPAMHLKDGVFRGETIKLVLPPDVSLTQWEDGPLRVASLSSELDGSQTLNLVSSLLRLGEKGRPRAVLDTSGRAFHVRQNLRWHLAPGGESLQAEVTLSPQRGRLHQLVLQLESAKKSTALKGSLTSWEVKTLSSEPKELVASWRQEGSLLHLELARGLTAPDVLRLNLKMGRPIQISAEGGEVRFPALEWIGATTLDGKLDISLDPVFQGALSKVDGLLPIPVKTDKEPPLFSLPLRKGAGDKEQTGSLRVVPRTGLNRARLSQDIHLKGDIDNPWLETLVHLNLQPSLGRPDTLDFYSGQPGIAWRVRGVESGPGVRSLERIVGKSIQSGLGLLGGSHPLEALALAGAQEQGEWWRLTLKGPINEGIALILAGSGPLPEGPLPLLTIPGLQEGRVRFHAKDHQMHFVHTQGLREGTEEPTDSRVTTFHFLESPFPSQLIVRIRPREPEPLLCDQASWITYLEPGKMPLHHFRFQVWGSQGKKLAVEMPPDSEVVAVRLEGLWQKNLGTKGPPEAPVLQVSLVKVPRQRVEILYRTPLSRPEWLPWSSVETLVPRLPVAPLWLDRRWRLHPHLVPLYQEAFQVGSGLDRGPGTKVDLADVWHVADPLMKGMGPFSSPRAESKTLPQVLAAEASLRPTIRPEMTLGEALALLLREGKAAALSIVVDHAALNAAGLGPMTALGSMAKESPRGNEPFWETLGLTLVPGREGLLLTTRSKEESAHATFGPDWADSFQAAIRQTRESGQEGAGTLMALVPWLFGQAPGLLEDDRDFPALAEVEGLGQISWREYRPLPGSTGLGEMTVVQVRSLHLGGILLALLSGFLFYLLLWDGAFKPWKIRLLLVVLAALGLTMVWLPATFRLALAWPLGGLSGGLLILYLFFLPRAFTPGAGSGPSTIRRARVVGMGAVLLLCWALGSRWVSGQPGKADLSKAESFPVYLIETAPGQETALVGPEVLKKLDELEARGRPRTIRALLRGANYQGRWQEGQFEVKGIFEVQTDTDLANLHLPLGGVDLKEGSLLDGAPVFPVPGAGTKGGFQVAVSGKGLHRLEVPFSVRLTAASDFQELRFTVPKLARSRLEFLLPNDLGAPFLVSCQGEETLRPGTSKEVQVLRAQLGREGTVQIRFPLDQVPGPTSTAEVREMYFWDLRPLTQNLTGVLLYTVNKGTLGQMEIELPEGMEVRSAEVFTFPGGPSAAPVPALRRWFLSGKGPKRLLHIEPSSPLGGKFQVQLSLVPLSTSGSGNLTLRLPEPGKVKIAESSLAYRLEGVEAREVPQNLTYTVLKIDQFLKAWKAAGQRETEAMLTKALTFRRSGKPSGFNLALSLPASQAVQEINWTVHGSHTDLAATLSVAAAQDDLTRIEWHIPPAIQVSAVRGLNVHHWSRHGDRVQIWLQQPVKKLTLQLSGWKKNEVPILADKRGQVHLPVFLAPGLKVINSRVQVSAAEGWALAVQDLKGLKSALPLPVIAGLAFQAEDGPGEGVFQVAPLAFSPWIQSRTEIALQDGHWQIQVSGFWHSPQAFPLRLTLEPGPAEITGLALDRSSGVAAIHHPGKGRHLWVLQPSEEAPRPWSFQIRYQVAAEISPSLRVPSVFIGEEKPKDAILVLQGPGLRLEKPHGLTLLKGEKPGGLELATVWKVPASLKHLLMVQGQCSEAASVQIPLGQQQALLSPEGKWLHQGGYLLLVQRPSEIFFQLPSGARLRGSVLDQHPVNPRPKGDHWLLSVMGAPGPKRLLLFWDFPEGERMERPRLDHVVFPEHPRTALMGSVALPSAWEIEQPSIAPTDPAMRFLNAKTLASLAKRAEDKTRSERASAQEFLLTQALQESRLAQWLLAAAGEDAGPLRSDVESLHKDLLTRLEKHSSEELRNLAESPGIKPSRPWEKLPGPSWRGPAWAWVLGERTSPPDLALAPPHRARQSLARRLSELILVTLAGLLIFSMLPRGQVLIRATWPEQLLAVTLLGTWAWGPSFLGVLLAGIGLLARIVWLLLLVAQWARVRWNRPTAENSSAFLDN